MGRSLVKAVFDTNILIDLLNGRVEANNEAGRYSSLAISRDFPIGDPGIRIPYQI
jgi:hypothetical protein